MHLLPITWAWFSGPHLAGWVTSTVLPKRSEPSTVLFLEDFLSYTEKPESTEDRRYPWRYQVTGTGFTVLMLCQPPGFPSVIGSLTLANAGAPTPAGSEGPLSPAQQSPGMEQSHRWKAGTSPGVSDIAVRGACPTFCGPRLIYSAAGEMAISGSAGGEGNGTPLQYSCLENPMDGGAWWAAVHGIAKSRIRLSDFTFTFHFHAWEKEMATHSSVLAWRIPGTGKPGGLPCMGLHRVEHNWSGAAAAGERPSHYQ